MIFNPEFWVAVAFVLFFGVLGYFGVHKMLLGGLDAHRDRVRAELDEARKLREEAQQILADYQSRQGAIAAEAEAIIAAGRAEAERLAAEGHAKVEEFVARRTKFAENKIAQAEAQAMAEVRRAAAEAAAKAAERILATDVKGKTADDLIAAGIAEVKTQLN